MARCARSILRNPQPSRRGTVLVAMILALTLMTLVAATVVLSGGRDQTLVVLRMQGERAAMGADAAASMAMREVIKGLDEDGDGVIGTISNDGNTATDPTINNGTRMWATKTVSGGTTTITAYGVNGDATRSVQVTLASSGGSSVLAGTVLLVVGNSGALTTTEQAKKTLLEGWGHTVALISDSANQAAFDAAVLTSSVAYISETSNEANVSTKLKGATIGVVCDEGGLCDEMGISTSSGNANTTVITITNNTHYITSGLSLGVLTIATNNSKLWNASGTLGGYTALATLSGSPTMVVMERAASLAGGGTAAGRRVFLPWRGGSGAFTFESDINASGQMLLKRSIEWCLMPVAQYALDDAAGTTAVDAISARNGTLTNGPAWTTGQSGGGLQFNGFDSYVTITNNAAFQTTAALSVTGWIRATSFGSGTDVDLILRKGDANPNNWQLSIANRRIEMCLDGNDGSAFQGNTTLNTGQWYHVAGTWDGSRVRLYLNGVLDNTPATKAAPIGTDTRPVYLGGRSGSTDVTNGVLDDVRFYNRALTAAEVAALATGGKPKVTGWAALAP